MQLLFQYKNESSGSLSLRLRDWHVAGLRFHDLRERSHQISKCRSIFWFIFPTFHYYVKPAEKILVQTAKSHRLSTNWNVKNFSTMAKFLHLMINGRRYRSVIRGGAIGLHSMDYHVSFSLQNIHH